MATKQKAGVRSQELEVRELVIRRMRMDGQANYLTAQGGWTSNLELAQTFASEGAAKKVLRNREVEIVQRPQF